MLAYIDRVKLEQEFKDIEHGIFVLTKGEWRATGYIRRVFYFLREHIELCEQEDWKRLYDECIYFQIVDAKINNRWSENNPEDQRGWIELLADLAIKHGDNSSGRFNQGEVEKFLEYRKTKWNQ